MKGNASCGGSRLLLPHLAKSDVIFLEFCDVLSEREMGGRGCEAIVFVICKELRALAYLPVFMEGFEAVKLYLRSPLESLRVESASACWCLF